ncbi:techylectin-5A-like [Ruditapes philippinarum]|uniref:techylectin-5A-like n=1 Tax=Ruditapes philippinarum TaxID=129788 RepID=UPI00295B0D34|nr:techylectin-5A-like [Ruditapes philippinarum]
MYYQRVKPCIFVSRSCYWILIVIFCISMVTKVAAENSRQYKILRERIGRLEGRFADDISLIREEFYNELNTLANKKFGQTINVNSTINPEIGSEIESLKIKVDRMINESFNRFNVLSEGSQQEKRIRREIQSEIDEIKEGNADVVNSVDRMSETVTSTINNIVEKMTVTEKMNDIVKVLEDVKDQLSYNIQNKCVHEAEKVERVADCADLLKQGYKTSGVYTVFPKTMWRPVKIYCDMETSGGGWTVFQRRKDGSENFNRKWVDYAFGFGNLSGEFWLGNEFIHRLTDGVPQELLIELEDFENDHRHASYGLFSVGSAEESYKLYVNFFTGNVTDSLGTEHSGHSFSTADYGVSSSCAKSYKGGWWYTSCHSVNINGLYLKGEHKSYADGVNWQGWRGYHYSLKNTEMKFRPH